MTSFLFSALLLLIFALVLLLRPLFFTTKALAISRRQMNAAIYREELDKLESDRQSGLVDLQAYELAHAEMRQRLFQDTTEEDDRSVLGSPKKTMVGLCIFIVILSSGFYFVLGDATRVAQQSSDRPVTQESVEKMVSEFAAKMEQEPDNLKGWAMLARSYQILGRNEEAAKAFERAGSFIDADPQLLSDYANVLVSNANGNFAGKPLMLINKALKLDPNNLLALWLSGTASFNAGNFQSAVQAWEKLQKQLPSQSDESRAITESIAEARSKGKLSDPSSMITSNKGISGVLELSADLKAKVKSTDMLMVIARKPGERMPVAVLKVGVSSFPINFVLNDSLAMNPNALISQLSEVSVEARISKTGMAMPEPGDLISAAQTIKVGTGNIRLIIDQIRQ
jgi:cytochrome c-type biogenesis protein CcmH